MGGIYWYGKYFELESRYIALQNLWQRQLIYHHE
jgi:hypothetical protein